MNSTFVYLAGVLFFIQHILGESAKFASMISFLKPGFLAGHKLSNRDETLLVGDRELPLKLRPNKRASRMTLRIDPGGQSLSLTVPMRVSDKEIDRFLEKNQGWLLTKLAKFPKHDGLEEGGNIDIRGIAHRIERTGQIRGLTEAINQDNQYILKVSGEAPHLQRRIVQFLKKEAKKDLEASSQYHAQKLGRSYKSLTLRDTRSRWGSCTSDGKLSYSWRIIMAPPFVLDYLAAHEVSHLAEMNHGPDFWRLCEQLCPHTQEAKTWLKRHGSLLHAANFN